MPPPRPDMTTPGQMRRAFAISGSGDQAGFPVIVSRTRAAVFGAKILRTR